MSIAKKRSHVPALFAITASLLMTGCVSQTFNRTPPGPVMAAAPMPSYKKGDRFTYDNGRTYRVVSAKNRRVMWKTGKGFRFTTMRNPLLPRLAWESRTKRSKLERIGRRANSLWPLRVGKSVSFTYTGTVTDKVSGTSKSFAQQWDCSVPRTQRLMLAAGTFDTYVVECDRQSVGFRTYYGTRTWYYAPEIGHVVQKEDTYSRRAGNGSTLVASKVTLPKMVKSDRRALKKNTQNILETSKSGQTVTWYSSDRTVRVDTTPHRTFRTKRKTAQASAKRSKLCRSFAQKFISRKMSKMVVQTACRKTSGRWQML